MVGIAGVRSRGDALAIQTVAALKVHGTCSLALVRALPAIAGSFKCRLGLLYQGSDHECASMCDMRCKRISIQVELTER
jgi:hypothetical protein